MKLKPSFNLQLIKFVSLIILGLFTFISCEQTKPEAQKPIVEPVQAKVWKNPYKGNFKAGKDSFQIELLNASFLHNTHRNYYGDSLPDQLNIIWKHDLGIGTTRVGPNVLKWAGAGWTGQPLMVRENGTLFLIQGAYDHHLKKIRASDGALIWQYKYDDVIKGTGSLWINHKAKKLEDFCIIMQGSRAGKSLASSTVPSFRAISYFTGKELWRMNVARTRSYSRDVDASVLVYHDTAYIGLENSIFTVFDPSPEDTTFRDGMYQPKIYRNKDTLHLPTDVIKHGGNLVTEASPVLLGERIYLASGSGHVWGYNLNSKKIDWDFFIGSDMDGTPSVTHDGCLLVTVEKQYIKGKGGLLKLDPARPPAEAAQWYLPVNNFYYATWQGGIIGSATSNVATKDSLDANLAAITAIDGNLYVVDMDTISQDSFPTFNNELRLPKPKILFKYPTGPAISTPLIIRDKLIAATYNGTYLFKRDSTGSYKLLEKQDIRCESTPFVHNKRVYVASRDRFLYCLGQ